MPSIGVGTGVSAADLQTNALHGGSGRSLPSVASRFASGPSKFSISTAHFPAFALQSWGLGGLKGVRGKERQAEIGAGKHELRNSFSGGRPAQQFSGCRGRKYLPGRHGSIWHVQKNFNIVAAVKSLNSSCGGTANVNHREVAWGERKRGTAHRRKSQQSSQAANQSELGLSTLDEPAVLSPEVLSEDTQLPEIEQTISAETEKADRSVVLEGPLRNQVLDLAFQSGSGSDGSEGEAEELPNWSTRALFGSVPDAPPADQPVLSASDPHRPAFHFQPESGFMNDPNGPVFIDNKYHIFYQFNPAQALWDWGVCWGHGVSADLVHWEHRPVALTPTPNSYDQDGIFSGCCVNDQGVATILYTGVQIAGPESTIPVTSVSQLLGAAFSEVQCVATCKDDGTFIKHGPVISAPPADLDLVGFRDPYVWREDDEWLMLLGSGIKEVGGTALLYRSPDLRQWDFVQPLIVGDSRESGTMWECPLLFKLGKWHVLCVSPDNPANPVLFWVGGFLNGQFIPVGPPKRLDLGNVVYAPNTCVDGKHRQLLWGWVQEVRDSEACVAAGYAGCLTLPRVVSISDEGDLLQYPAEELSLLREARLVHEHSIPLGSYPRLYGVRTGCLEIEARFDRGTADAVGIDIRELPTSSEGDETTPLAATRAQKMLRTDPHEGVLVSYDFKRKWLEVAWWQPGPDQGLDARGELVSKGGALILDENEPLNLRVFLDRSVVEVFANNRACLTTRMYRAVIGVALIAKGGDAIVQSVDMWRMGSMKPEAHLAQGGVRC